MQIRLAKVANTALLPWTKCGSSSEYALASSLKLYGTPRFDFASGSPRESSNLWNNDILLKFSPISFLLCPSNNLASRPLKLSNLAHFFLSSSLVTGAHTITCGEVGCPGFEPRPLHKLCNVPINWVKLTGTWLGSLYSPK